MLAVKLKRLQAFQMSEAISKAQAKRVKLAKWLDNVDEEVRARRDELQALDASLAELLAMQRMLEPV